ncbi:hypothetical protein F4561_001469 [Lipingzhangella halophila]|uniref:3'-phosphoadenosine 5'-phosphosulfate sulfotransferase (PAPS reductase)/FAD synthetase n=1 Tax=Lipingzhangella halophila TaxID=1783352 RepID=A0A7W7RER6_9ACTN|nr:hypothetical protein [Lipingzhangella halophila]MBB4930649.1 hypothetical protein [Lipingzhangella halophila]
MPTPTPRLRLLSLGAGVQSSALLLLAAQSAVPCFDYALFADTGWEPPSVYAHLERLGAIAAEAGIPLHRVSAGNIRDDALDAQHRFASMPLFITGANGERRMGRRQCTAEYKIRPLKKEARRLLGYPHPNRVPEGVYAEQSIGISTEEFHRAKDADVGYLGNRFPLIEIGWTRRDCRALLTHHGLGDTPKSACVGCPFRSNESWAELKSTEPEAFEDAVAFDAAIRHGPPAAASRGMPHGTFYLHRDRVPLGQVALGIDTGPEPEGCSPWSCRGEDPHDADTGGAA